MSRFLRILACSALLGAAPALAWGQASDDPILVSASRLATVLDGQTASSSTLDGADLERRQTQFAVDAIATLPGVAVAQSGAFGGVASVRLRGASSQQTLVLIDGVAVNDPSAPGGGYDFSSLDAADIARIDVLRGPQSTLWGSDAIGGVIAIETRRPADGVSARALVEGGSFDTRRISAALGYGGGTFVARISGTALQSEGISKADARDGNRETDPYSSETVNALVGWSPRAAFRLEAFGRRVDSETAFDGFGFPTGVVDADETAFVREQQAGVRARASLFDGRFVNVVSASRFEIDRRNESAAFGGFSAQGARDGLRYQGTVDPGGAWRVAFGAEREDSSVAGLGDTRIEGVYVAGEARPRPWLTLTAGVRRDDHSTFGVAETARVGARYNVADAFGVRASWGQGYKAPTVFQLASFFPPAAGPNLALQPEEAEGWDAAVYGAWAQGHVSAEVGIFSLDTANLIDFASGRYLNVARAESRGVEAVGAWRVHEGVDVRVSYTYTQATDAATGRVLARIPEHAAFLEGDWRASAALRFNAGLRYNGAESDGEFSFSPTGGVDAWTRLDVGARYGFGAGVEAFARIENVTDEAYQDIYGYGAPGRWVRFGLRVRGG